MRAARDSLWVPDILRALYKGWLTHGQIRRHFFLLTITFH